MSNTVARFMDMRFATTRNLRGVNIWYGPPVATKRRIDEFGKKSESCSTGIEGGYVWDPASALAFGDYEDSARKEGRDYQYFYFSDWTIASTEHFLLREEDSGIPPASPIGTIENNSGECEIVKNTDFSVFDERWRKQHFSSYSPSSRADIYKAMVKIFFHETGHVLNLGHVHKDKTNVMYPRYDEKGTGFGLDSWQVSVDNRVDLTMADHLKPNRADEDSPVEPFLRGSNKAARETAEIIRERVGTK